eukprot:COSAG02_NODE_138_length_34440_cov_16.694368_19_plen_207_part_00
MTKGRRRRPFAGAERRRGGGDDGSRHCGVFLLQQRTEQPHHHPLVVSAPRLPPGYISLTASSMAVNVGGGRSTYEGGRALTHAPLTHRSAPRHSPAPLTLVFHAPPDTQPTARNRAQPTRSPSIFPRLTRWRLQLGSPRRVCDRHRLADGENGSIHKSRTQRPLGRGATQCVPWHASEPGSACTQRIPPRTTPRSSEKLREPVYAY